MSTTELSYTLADVQVLAGTMLNVSIAPIIYAIQHVTIQFQTRHRRDW